MAKSKKVIINGKEYNRETFNGKSFYGKTKKEAREKRDEYKNNLKQGLNISKETLYKAMYIWLWEVVKVSVKSTTFERYEIVLRCHIKDCEIANIPLKDIIGLQLQRYFNSLIDKKTESQIKFIFKLMRKFFIYAADEGYIAKNPFKNIKIAESEDVEDDNDMVISTDEEIRKIYNSEDCQIKFIALFAMVSGLREGEILSLEEKDIKDMEINIYKTVRYTKIFDSRDKWHYEFKVTKPKTKKSIRKVPLPSSFKPILNKILEYNKEMRKHMENPSTLLFPSITGNYIDSKNMRTSYQRMLTRLNILDREFHNLRHTYATKLFENGASILTVSRLLGHSSIKTTERIYIHIIKRLKIKEVETLNDLFDDKIKNKLKILA